MSKLVLQISCLYNIINIFMDIVAFYKQLYGCLGCLRIIRDTHILRNYFVFKLQ